MALAILFAGAWFGMGWIVRDLLATRRSRKQGERLYAEALALNAVHPRDLRHERMLGRVEQWRDSL
jgi:hypothetical protein